MAPLTWPRRSRLGITCAGHEPSSLRPSACDAIRATGYAHAKAVYMLSRYLTLYLRVRAQSLAVVVKPSDGRISQRPRPLALCFDGERSSVFLRVCLTELTAVQVRVRRPVGGPATCCCAAAHATRWARCCMRSLRPSNNVLNTLRRALQRSNAAELPYRATVTWLRAASCRSASCCI